MKRASFYFDLPEKLIAQYPTKFRGESNLLVLEKSSGKIEDKKFKDFIDYVPEKSILVFNNSKVRKSRIYGDSETGGKIELLWIKKIDERVWEVITNRGKKQKVGKKIYLPDDIVATIIDDREKTKYIELSKKIDENFFEKNGHIPLPPYIKREAEKSDDRRYQTIFSKKIGSSAAPTAGLHFTKNVLEQLEKKGVEILFITLHVGLGTFLPIKTENIEEHKMHKEFFSISEDVAEKINLAKKNGRAIFAVGTTSVRALESSFDGEKILSGERETDIYIYPSYEFKVVDKLFTNFHTPDSTLVLLVSAFAGVENIKKSYKHAIEKEYRFFSYGDAMLII